MKKYFYSLFAVLVAMTGFTSCSSDDDDYQWATVEGQQVFFKNNLPTQYDVSFENNSISIPVSRISTTDALTVNIKAEDPDAFFTFPSSVSFAPGESTANLVVNYDPQKLEYNVYHKANIILESDQTTPYGPSTYAFSAGAPYTFTSLGKGTFVDNWYSEYKGSVEVLQNDQNPNLFRLLKPYAGFKGNDNFKKNTTEDAYLQFEILKKGDVIDGVTIAHDDLIYFDEFCTGNNMTANGYNTDIVLLHVINFKAGEDEANWLYSKVVEYQSDGKPAIVQFAPYFYMYGLGGFNESKNDDVLVYYFPGCEPKDYDVAIDYLGAFIDAEKNAYGQLATEVGADLDEARVAIVPGEHSNEGLFGIIDGSVESVSITEGGALNIPCDYNGICTAFIIGFAEDDAQTYDFVVFDFEYGKPVEIIAHRHGNKITKRGIFEFSPFNYMKLK